MQLKYEMREMTRLTFVDLTFERVFGPVLHVLL